MSEKKPPQKKQCLSCLKCVHDAGGEPLEVILETLLAQACEIVIDTAEQQGVMLPPDIYDRLQKACVAAGIMPDNYPTKKKEEQ